MSLSRADIELTFIRSLACGGYVLSGDQMSAEDRAERIRVAIMKQQVNNLPFPIDPSITFAQAFQMAYHRSCELRRFERDQYGRNTGAKTPEPPNDDDDDLELEDAELGLL
jgi:hypothetical protein